MTASTSPRRSERPCALRRTAKVVYRGSELEGYGNLLLIKHDDGFVTAYAHNDAMLVKKGDRVRQGQVIAESRPDRLCERAPAAF